MRPAISGAVILPAADPDRGGRRDGGRVSDAVSFDTAFLLREHPTNDVPRALAQCDARDS